MKPDPAALAAAFPLSSRESLVGTGPPEGRPGRRRTDPVGGVRGVPPPEQRLLTVVLHDVAPATQAECQKVLSDLAAITPIPVTLLAVPCYRGQLPTTRFERWLDDAVARGDELALHGYTHVDQGRPQGLLDHLRRRFYTAGEGEFSALSAGEAEPLLRAGRYWFARHGWPLSGFVAPAWLMSAGTLDAVENLGFSYTATLSSLIALPSRRHLQCQSLVYSTRAGWRRASSLLWNQAVFRTRKEDSLLRLELHPADSRYPAIRRSWMRIVEESLRDRHPVTVRAALQRKGLLERSGR